MQRFFRLLVLTALFVAGLTPPAASAFTTTLSDKVSIPTAKGSTAFGRMPAGLDNLFMKGADNMIVTSRRALKAPTHRPHKAMGISSKLPANLIGQMLYSSAWSYYDKRDGLYYVSTANPEEFTLASKNGNFGGVIVDGVYYSTYMITYSGMVYGVYTLGVDMETLQQVSYLANTAYDQIALSCATDPADNTVYAVTYNASGLAYQLSKLVYSRDATVQSTRVGDLDGDIMGLTIDPQGQLYGFRKVIDQSGVYIIDTELVKIDKTSGATTVVGSTGVLSQYLSDAIMVNGSIFWTVCTQNEAAMYEVDPATGEATKLFDYPNHEQIIGLALAPALAEDDAPDAVDNLTVASAAGGAESAHVTFDSPTCTYDKTPATGALTYHIAVDGTEIASGATTFGASVATDIDIAGGNHEFKVWVSNDKGDSPARRVTAYIGKDTPATPLNVKATLDEATGKVTITWDPVTTGLYGGYFDATKIAYKVVRTSPDGAVLTDNARTTTFTDDLGPEPSDLTVYQYSVTALFDGVSSETAASQMFVRGARVDVPYLNTFDQKEDIYGWTIIDANNDNNTWLQDTWNGNMTTGFSMYGRDDWFISPKAALQANHTYVITAKVRAPGYEAREVIEIKAGNAATVEAMTQAVIAPTEVTAKDYIELTANFTPAETANYYLGFHLLTTDISRGLDLDDLEITELIEAAPAASEDLKALDTTGDHDITVTFKAPTKTNGGATLASISSVEVCRDGETVKTFTSVTPGASLSFVDEDLTPGYHYYTVYANNAAGRGSKASVMGYAGTNKPGFAQNVKLRETENIGEITVSWDPITVDVDGRPINPDKVTYTLMSVGYETFFTGLTETSVTFRPYDDQYQRLLQCYVIGYTEGGEGYYAVTPSEPIGPAYKGLSESFADGMVSYMFGMDGEGGGYWITYLDGASETFASADYDNGYEVFVGNKVGDYADFYTCNISLDGMTDPTLSFYRFGFGKSDDNTLEVLIRERQGTYSRLSLMKGSELGEKGWHKVTCSLKDYVGKDVQLIFRGTRVNNLPQSVVMDRLRVNPSLPYDVMAQIKAPEKVNLGKDYFIDLRVVNDGELEATNVVVKLFVNNELKETEELGTMYPGQEELLDFNYTMLHTVDGPLYVYATVSADHDNIADNNTTDELTITPVIPKLPVVTTLAGESTGPGSNTLTWTQPDFGEPVAMAYTEDFEDATPWSHKLSDWIFVDRDGEVAGGFSNVDIPGLRPTESKTEFFIFDTDDDCIKNSTSARSFAAHSGSKYLASIYNYTGRETDDWAISPELSGNAQTVSFYARSYHPDMLETIEFWYSTGSTDPDEFTKVERIENVPYDPWTLYSFEIPEGAKRFAIRTCSSFKFMIMIDDITYERINNPDAYKITGYNIYRDGKKITKKAVTELTYVDNLVPEGKRDYYVTAVYKGMGESAGSNVVSVETTSLEDTRLAGVTITAADRRITVAGAEGLDVTVANPAGMSLYSGRPNATVSIPVTRGVYIVKAGRKVAKVAVN